MYAQVSFSVRDDATNSILLRVGKFQKSSKLLTVICEQPVTSKQVRRIKSTTTEYLNIKGFWGVDCTKSQKIQQIILNLRPVNCPVLEIFIIRSITEITNSNESDTKTLNLQKNIFFLLFIECSKSEYTLSVNNNSSLQSADFYCYASILESITISLREFKSKKLNPPSAETHHKSIPLICRLNSIGNSDLKLASTFFTRVTSDVRRKNSGVIVPKRECEFSKLDDAALVSQQCIKKLRFDPGDFLSTIQNPKFTSLKLNSLEASMVVKEYNNYDVAWISQKCVEKQESIIEEIQINDCSQWSDWIYEDREDNKSKAPALLLKRFRFLPLNLHALLPLPESKLISRANLDDDLSASNSDFKLRRQDLEVRPCARRRFEFRLKLDSLKSMKVI